MKKKVLALALSFVLVACATFGITLAWLKTETGKIENTFTVGKVEINLYEIDANDNNLSPTASMFTGNYKIIPGTSEKKQPYVTVKAGSEKCYVYILVKNDFYNVDAKDPSSTNASPSDPAVSYTVNAKKEATDDAAAKDGWVKIVALGLEDGCELYRYTTEVNAKGNDISTTCLFDEVEYNKLLTKESVEGLKTKTIQVSAFAIQADYLASSSKSAVEVADEQAIAWAKNEYKN